VSINAEPAFEQTQDQKRRRLSVRESKKPVQDEVPNVWPKNINQFLKEKPRYEDLPMFTTRNAHVNEDALDCIVDVFMILKKAYRFRSLNEAGRSVFIALVLALVVTNIASGAVVKPQYRFRKGLSGQIVPDWVIKRGSEILLVVEAKTHTFSGDVTQHIEQLHAAYKEICSSRPNEQKTVHGLITTADKWLLVMANFSDEKCEIMRGRTCPWELPLNSEKVDRNQLKSKLKALVEQLAWFSSE
jgi:hypothetical protein